VIAVTFVGLPRERAAMYTRLLELALEAHGGMYATATELLHAGLTLEGDGMQPDGVRYVSLSSPDGCYVSDGAMVLHDVADADVVREVLR
jgi:hypothetical protein